jgi:RNA polymerase sigma-70 factor (ECF subfamily)
VNARSEESDNELARRAAAGDEGAFGELVGRHKAGLYRLLRRYAGDPDDAYDAVQDTFIAAWHARGRYDPARPFGAWLRTIALNKARDRARRAAVRRLLFGSGSDEADAASRIPDAGPLMDEVVIAEQQRRRLEQAIAGLPRKLKEAIVLTAIDGCSHEEAAVILGVTVKAIEMRVSRARRSLADRLTAGAGAAQRNMQ